MFHEEIAHMRPARFPLYLFMLALMLALSGSNPSLNRALPSSSPPPASIPSIVQTTTTQPIPVRLIIPQIEISAPIESLGILPNGDLATPTRNPWEDVGWYNAGPLPGQRGSAVIDGHLDRPGGYPAVFWRLRELQVGNNVWVITADGTRLHFLVTRVAFYPPQEAPIQDIFGNTGGNYLNLITCAGDWIPSEHQTTLRLVVYSTLV
jgi:sortase (surface protein transpeptidase)